MLRSVLTIIPQNKPRNAKTSVAILGEPCARGKNPRSGITNAKMARPRHGLTMGMTKRRTNRHRAVYWRAAGPILLAQSKYANVRMQHKMAACLARFLASTTALRLPLKDVPACD